MGREADHESSDVLRAAAFATSVLETLPDTAVDDHPPGVR